MKRGWLVVFIALFLAVGIVSGLQVNKNTYDGCYGANLCGDNYTCGYYDDVCVNDFFIPAYQDYCNLYYPDVDYKKCIDPDCGPDTCFWGHVYDLTGMPISGITVTYKQNVWNGTQQVELTKEVTTNAFGYYNITAWPGPDILLVADGQSQGYSYDIHTWNEIIDGCHEHDFTLTNGTCQGDCTKIGSQYCFADCEGEGTPTDICQYNHTETFWTGNQTINIKSAYEACTQIGMRKGSYATLGRYMKDNIQWCVRANCCEGAPYQVPCPVTEISSNIEDAVKVTRLAKLKGQAIKLRIYYWE